MKRKMIVINLALAAMLPIIGICNITNAAEPMENVTPIPIESELIQKQTKIIDEIFVTETIEEVPTEILVEIPTKEYRYIEGCPLSTEIQEGIFDICEEYGVSFELVMSIIMQESSFRPNALGDSGKSKGLMQIQQRWHYEIMEEIGVTDLYDPLGNVEVGVAILKDYFEEHGEIYHVLMRYNGGAAYAESMMKAGKVSEYAQQITERAVEYEKSNGI